VIANAGAALVSISSDASADDVALRAEALILTAEPDGLNLGADTQGATTSLGQFYQCPTSGVRHAIASVILTNADSVKRQVRAQVVPSGGGADEAQNVINRQLFAGESVAIEWLNLEPGDSVYIRAAANSVVGAYISVVEFVS
jgi:hypothetical protein